MASNIVPFEHQLALADSIAKSSLFGIKTRDQAIVLMALCEAEGLHPIVACRDFNIIQGRPALKADAMLTRFQAAGGKVRWLTYTDENVTGEFTHPSGGTITVDWTMERAQRAGLAGKGPWVSYPRAMLRARVISEAIRSVYPGVLSGLYTPEEVGDMPPQRPLRDVTPKSEARKPADDLEDFAGDYAKPVHAETPQQNDAATMDRQFKAPPPAHDAETGELVDDGEGRFRIPMPEGADKDAIANWCSDYRDALMGAGDEDDLLAIRAANKDVLLQLSTGGNGGRKAADRLQGIFTSQQIELRRRAAAT